MAYPALACHPPLGQLTVFPPGTDEVTVYLHLEWHKSRPDFPWEIFLCTARADTNEHPSQWAQTSMRLSSRPSEVLRYPSVQDDYHSTYEAVISTKDFSEVPGSSHILFTTLFRVDSFAPWQLAETALGIPNGEIVIQQAYNSGSAFSSFLLEPGWIVKDLPSVDAHATTVEITSDQLIPKSQTPEQPLQTCTLGRIQNLLRFFTIVRLEPYWAGPRSGSKFFYISEDSLLCCFLTDEGKYITLLALNGIDDVYTVIRSGSRGEIIVAARNDGSEDTHFRVLVSIALDLESSVATVLHHSRKILMTTKHMNTLKSCTQDIVPDASCQQDIEEWFDSLAFCTWNALGPELSKDRLLSTLDTLSRHGIYPSTLLIDDNWQTCGLTDKDFTNPFYRGWADMEANQEGFPGGLKKTLDEIRSKYPMIKDIGVWHALFGYWGGISAQGSIAQKYKTRKVAAKLMQNVPASVTVIDDSEIDRFFDDFYRFLASSGVTFVKTDVQHMLSMLEDSKDRAALVPAYQRAWTTAYLRNMSGKAISCMSQVPQIMFHSLLQNFTSKILIRNSDDFYPEVAASHPWHLWANAHNAILTQHLNGVPDWDMFQTSHSFSAYHAAARCISGGPVLITDTPGEHDIDLIHQIFALSPQGRSISLRPNLAKTTRVFDKYTDGHVLKIGTTVGERLLHSSILGCFNVSERDIGFILTPSDFPEITKHDQIRQIIIRAYCTSQIFGPFAVKSGSDSGSLLYAKLPVRGFEILTASPMLFDTNDAENAGVAVLGLLDKLSGAAAVTSVSTVCNAGRVQVKIGLKALGKLGLWVSRLPSTGSPAISATLFGHNISSRHINVQSTLKDGGSLVEIDLIKTWEELRMQSSEARVVDIEVHVHQQW